jgi:hypothetical protein
MPAPDPTLRSVSTGDLIRQPINDVQTLVDRQVQLAKREFHEEGRR